MLADLRHRAVLTAKRLVYGERGEPYRIAGHTLRYVPGSRPVRTRHVTSPNNNTRYDAMQVQFFASKLSEGDLVVDIGAHAGQYAIIMAAACGPTGQVIAFEPDPHARGLLERNLDLNPHLKRPKVEAFALFDTLGEAVLFSREGDSQSSLARTAMSGGSVEGAEQVTVSLMTLDAYLANNGLPAPRWVKIDTEGAEIRILKGAANLLASEAGVVCELHPYAWPEFGNTVDELKALAAASRRRIRYMDEETEISDEPVYGTVLLERIS